MFIPQGLRLVHSGSVTQANMKLASVDAGAMIDIGVDWSAYAGNDAGSTPHLLVLYDHLGNRLQGFIGANGGGLAYGGEIVTDSSFNNWTGVVLDDWGLGGTTGSYEKEEGAGAYGGAGISVKLTRTGVSGYLHDRTNSVTAEKLYKFSFAYKNTAGDLCAIQLWDGTQNADIIVLTTQASSTSWTTNSYYPVAPVGCSLIHINLGLSAINDIVWFDIVSLKQVTDISTNGVHLHSTKNGTNRNVASIDSAFDLNDSSGYTFKVYKCP